MDFAQYIDIDAVRKLAKNILPVIVPVTFIYLFYLNKTWYLLVLSIISLIFLALYINLFERLFLAGQRKAETKKCETVDKYSMVLILTFCKDRFFQVMILLSAIFSLVAFIFICLNLNDVVTWILFFLIIFAMAHYITAFVSSAYVGSIYETLFCDVSRKKK